MKNKIMVIFILLVMVSAFTVSVSAEVAADLEETFTISTGEAPFNICDGEYSTYLTIPGGGSITVECDGISALYVQFHMRAKEWTAVYDGGESVFGRNGFLHEYAKLPSVNGKVTMIFPEETFVAEIRALGDGTIPDDVQVWEPSFEKADVMLLTSHSDDEHLFFAGLIPHCVANDIDLQVVYFCYHDDVPTRLHEQLNGLWAVGVTHYPVIGRYPDLYSEGIDYAVNVFGNHGYTREDFVGYQCEMIRRFKPEIVVGHDVNGEYGHGTHALNTSTLIEALDLTNDSANYPDSAEMYGIWAGPKTSIHLWSERKILMNYDLPLDRFGGKTAYQMSVEGYGYHYSQHWTWFTTWLKGTDAAPIAAATQITEYSPCEFGLYRTTVGDDVNGDMFENVTLRKDVPEETLPPQITEPAEVSTDVDESEESNVDDSEESNAEQTEDSEPETKSLSIVTIVIIVIAVALVFGCITVLITMKLF